MTVAYHAFMCWLIACELFVIWGYQKQKSLR